MVKAKSLQITMANPLFSRAIFNTTNLTILRRIKNEWNYEWMSEDDDDDGQTSMGIFLKMH